MASREGCQVKNSNCTCNLVPRDFSQPWGGNEVVAHAYCSGTILVSLARVQIHNLRHFFQAQQLNKSQFFSQTKIMDYLYYFYPDIKLFGRRKRLTKSVHTGPRMQIMTLAAFWGIFLIDVVLNWVIVPQIIYYIVPYAREFLPIKFFQVFL